MELQKMSLLPTKTRPMTMRPRLILEQMKRHFLESQSPRLLTKKERSLMGSNFGTKKDLELQKLC
jgi:hypothetical protein